MKFSLVMGTIGRTADLTRFMEYLIMQDYPDLEFIVVDQNEQDFVGPLLAPYREKVEIIHLHSQPGLSRARNVGLLQVTGDFITFPDDDCWYPPGLLKTISQLFQNHPEIDGFTGRSIDEKGGSLQKFDGKSGYLQKLNVWTRTSSVALFFRAEILKRVSGFDETLGLGSGTSWGAAEDVDIPLRIIAAGYRLFFDPSIIVYHPDLRLSGYEVLSRRAYGYGAGIGRVWKIHQFPLWYVGYHILRPLGGAALSWVRGDLTKSRYHWLSLRGRLDGWRSKQPLSL